MIRPLTVFPLIALLTHGAFATEVIRLTTQDWPPYEMDVNGTIDGVSVRVVNCTIKRLNLSPEITLLPWIEAQQSVRDGRADGFFGAARSADRDRYATLSAAIAPQAWRWYWLPNQAINVSDLRTPVAVQSGTATEQWLRESGYINVRGVATIPDVVTLLESGQVAVALANQLAFEWHLAIRGMGSTILNSKLLRDGELGVYFSNGFLARHPGFLDRFNAETGDCRLASHLPEPDTSPR